MKTTFNNALFRADQAVWLDAGTGHVTFGVQHVRVNVHGDFRHTMYVDGIVVFV